MTSDMIDPLKVYFIENTSRLGRAASSDAPCFILPPTSNSTLLSANFSVLLPSATWSVSRPCSSPQISQIMTDALVFVKFLAISLLVASSTSLSLSL